MTTVAVRRPAPPLAAILLPWLVLAAAASAAGLVERFPLPLPTLILALTGALLFALWRVEALREQVWEMGPVPLVALHLVRFVGVAFLVLSARGELPASWALPTGWGDIAVAVAAVPLLLFARPFRTAGQRRALLAWNVFGLADMLLVVAGAVRLFIADPAAGAVMQRLPMSLLPTFVVPLVLASHVLLFVWLRRTGTGPGRE